VEKVLGAFLEPMAEEASRSPRFVKVMGRIIAEGLLPSVVEKNFRPVSGQFFRAIRRAVPYLPEEEFQWRQQFLIGAMAHTMCGCSEAGHAFEERIAYLIQFLAAGFYAPAAKVEVSA